MRLIRRWYYNMGTKPPFCEWPELVHRFLDRHGLSSRAFLYCFSDILSESAHWNPAILEEETAVSGCKRAFKACPSFGEPRMIPGRQYGGLDELVLSNIDTGSGCTEAEILPLMKRIHRSWGFASSAIYYYDVDFFGKMIPWERDLQDAREFSAMKHLPFEPMLFLGQQPFGSGIKLERFSYGKQEITFSIDLLHDGVVLDPAPYMETMRELLPNRHPQDVLQILFTPEEKQEYAARQASAEPLAEACRAWLAQRLSKGDNQTQSFLFPEYKMANKLKALAKKYGFDYKFVINGNFTLTKRTAQGHCLELTVDSGPSHFATCFDLIFRGLGFSHLLYTASFHPQDQTEFDICAERVAAGTAAFAEEALTPLSRYYPDTPDWFLT